MTGKTGNAPFEFLPRSLPRAEGFIIDRKHQVVSASGEVVAKAVDRHSAEMIADALNRQVPADVVMLDALKAAQTGFRKVWPLVSAYRLGGRREACKAGAEAVEIALAHLRYREPDDGS